MTSYLSTTQGSNQTIEGVKDKLKAHLKDSLAPVASMHIKKILPQGIPTDIRAFLTFAELLAATKTGRDTLQSYAYSRAGEHTVK